MKVLILFATVEGQTGKIANFIKEEAQEGGHSAVVIDLSDNSVPISFKGVERVVLAASVHERRHPKLFEAFLTASQERLSSSHTLMISVSLNAAFPEGRSEAQDYVDEMCMRTGLKPNKTTLVAGAVRNQNYDYFAQQVIRHVVLRGRGSDQTDGDQEFTDWTALSKTLSEFMAPIGS